MEMENPSLRLHVDKVSKEQYLILSSNYLSADIAFANENKISNFVLSDEFYLFNSTNYLSGISSIKELTVGVANIDVSGLKQFINLKRLFLHGRNRNIDFQGMRNLEFLQVSFGEKINYSGLENLNSFIFRDCRDKLFNWKKNFFGLSSLEKLELTDCYLPQQLDFLSNCHQLKELEIYLNPKPFRLQALRQNTSLEKLILSQCPHLQYKEDIPLLQTVKWLRLTDCGPIENCSLFYDMPNLEVLIVTGKSFFINGDLSGMMGKLKHFGFEKKRHYSHKPEDFPSIFRK